MVEQTIDGVWVVMLAKFFHDISVDIGICQSSTLCIMSFVFDIEPIALFAQKLKTVAFWFLVFPEVLPSLN